MDLTPVWDFLENIGPILATLLLIVVAIRAPAIISASRQREGASSVDVQTLLARIEHLESQLDKASLSIVELRQDLEKSRMREEVMMRLIERFGRCVNMSETGGGS